MIWRLSNRDRLFIDGSHGEGGGQILRTTLTLSIITGRPIFLDHIRAFRRNPGLAAQHLTAVRAAASLCNAKVSGDALGSMTLEFRPERPVASGNYFFDVADARHGGSAGAIMLVLQTLLLALSITSDSSRVELHGGTHLPWSPPFDYVQQVWLPALARLGIKGGIDLRAWGWYPLGKGEVHAWIEGLGTERAPLKPLHLLERGMLRRISGRAVAANLPSHIPQRMTNRVQSMLAGLGAKIDVEPLCVHAACAGAGLFLTAEYANVNCGFNAIGAVGKPSEQVADEASEALLKHHFSRAALDRHLGDQILSPLCFARGASQFSTEEITRHLETNAWVIERFGIARIVIERAASGTGQVTVIPIGLATDG